jgi:LCP family protein required for cell wall assembly
LAIGVASLLVLVVVLVAAVFVYAKVTFDKVHKTAVQGLTPRAPGKPFDVLLVGSDTRAFVDNSQQAAAYGSAQSQTGQRSDVIIIARIVPATHQVKLLSIPRDTYVDIPGNVQYVSGPNKINVAYNNGPSLLVKTIEQTFHIPITYYASLDFPAFEGMVNALGGIYLDFPYPAKDPYSGLDITPAQAGRCSLINGTQALGLVRSRHYYYYANGAWQYDGLSDLSRIRRQDAFFTAVLDRVRSKLSLLGLPTLNSFVSAASTGLTIDNSLSEGEIVSIARMFRGVSSAALKTETLPTAPDVVNGEDVMMPAAPDAQVVASFLDFGVTSPAQTTAAGGAAGSSPGSTAASLRAGGARVPGARLDAVRLAARASAGLATAPAASPATSPATSSATPTTLPAIRTVPGYGLVTNPAQIDYNTQPEPWNPVACTP